MYTKQNYHFGVVIPASNITVERELFSILNSKSIPFTPLLNRVYFHFARAGFETRYRISPKKYLTEVIEDVPNEVRKLNKNPIQNCGFFCTSATIYLKEREDLTKLIHQELGYKLITPVKSIIKALEHVSSVSPLFVTPYAPEISDVLRKEFYRNGIHANDIISLNLTTSSDLLEFSTTKLLDKIRSHFRPDRNDSVCVMCTNFPTFHLIEAIEAELKVPFVSSNQATVVAMFSKANLNFSLSNFGKFSQGTS